MAESVLAALLAQKQPAVDGNQALLVFGLQNDFVGPNPKVQLSMDSGWVERIKELVPKFREYAGDIIFVRSEVAQDSLKNLDSDKVILNLLDPEGSENVVEGSKDGERSPSKGKKKTKRSRMAQFLKDIRRNEPVEEPSVPIGTEAEEIYRNRGGDGPCCEPGSEGAALRADIQALVEPEDILVVKSNFSAFTGTDLLIQLRMKIITELYLVGCLSNMSIFATAQEAASHGFVLNIVEDCLGYKSKARHDVALNYMKEQMGAYTTTSSAILAAFEDSTENATGTQAAAHEGDAEDPFGLNAALEALGLEGKDRRSVQSQDMDVTSLAESLAASSLNVRSLNLQSPPQTASASRPPTAGAANESQSPSLSKNLRSFRSTPDIRNRANVRVRVRRRAEADLPNVPELPKAALHSKTLSHENERAEMIQSILEAKKDQEKKASPQKKGESSR
ncbi:uncharacterized protein PV09_01568 [Verruconis gallopava]|uniref:Isochorismatase-like domain-containing protein n=1 Tax=Verruconis gallopava TaxID=253628 RepID=A0A0D1XXV6_9PEZI|nr:uncharacterized protein PV09_01568 [Verruconis gallopava]KIW07621.1 hypothetical protein PV09_01568 [Verruconis gallopava]